MSNSARSQVQYQNDAIQEVSKLVSRHTGVQLGERQSVMVETRLKRRMAELGIHTFEEYLTQLRADPKTETSALISLLTTHHTYFFREFSHFEYLEKKALQSLIQLVRGRGDRKIRIWSAACSRGQEVYSLAMFLNHHLARMAPDVSFEIVGSDVDPESVAIAANGVYHRREIKEVPMTYLADHWVRGTGDIEEFVKVKKELKKHCRFEMKNLLNIPGGQGAFDVIFCRNVFIYFTPEQVKSISNQLLSHLGPQGYFFVGISESLSGLNLPVTTHGPSIYTRAIPVAAGVTTAKVLQMPTSGTSAREVKSNPTPEPQQILRVLCVDDSPSILTLLKQILKKEDGFEIVATAGNGLEAAKMIKEHQIDVVTLDIHMPEQTGVEYLQKNFTANHPAVVMITSVARENADLAMKALNFGASDYIEKPALSNLKERGEEIRTKLRCAYQNRRPASAPLSLDRSFQTRPKIKHPESKLRVVVASFSDRAKLKAMLKELQGFDDQQPPTVVLIEAAGHALEVFSNDFSKELGKSATFSENSPPKTEANQLYFADFKNAFDGLKASHSKAPTSIVVFGQLSLQAQQKIQSWGITAQVLAEDLGKNTPAADVLRKTATDVVPATSFAYMSCEYLSK
ncbi:MAG: response regulator [Methylotenera sp.]|nr:response regulator [Oligoflexia bacterium]